MSTTFCSASSTMGSAQHQQAERTGILLEQQRERRIRTWRVLLQHGSERTALATALRMAAERR